MIYVPRARINRNLLEIGCRRDALYDASKRIAENGAFGAVIIAWYEKDDNGLPIVKYAAAQSDPRCTISLMADTLFEMQMGAREKA